MPDAGVIFISYSIGLFTGWLLYRDGNCCLNRDDEE